MREMQSNIPHCKVEPSKSSIEPTRKCRKLNIHCNGAHSEMEKNSFGKRGGVLNKLVSNE